MVSSASPTFVPTAPRSVNSASSASWLLSQKRLVLGLAAATERGAERQGGGVFGGALDLEVSAARRGDPGSTRPPCSVRALSSTLRASSRRVMVRAPVGHRSTTFAMASTVVSSGLHQGLRPALEQSALCSRALAHVDMQSRPSHVTSTLLALELEDLLLAHNFPRRSSGCWPAAPAYLVGLREPKTFRAAGTRRHPTPPTKSRVRVRS